MNSPYTNFLQLRTVASHEASVVQDSFVSDPSTIVKNGQQVHVRISSWDEKANRLSLTMKLTTDSGMNGSSNGAGPSDDGQARRTPRQGKVATAGAQICSKSYFGRALCCS